MTLAITACAPGHLLVDYRATIIMFIARTKGCDLVTVRALEEIAPKPGCQLAGR